MKKNHAFVAAAMALLVVAGSAGSVSAGLLDTVRGLFVRPAPNILPEPTITEITVTSPNGGEVWTKGTSYKITWNVNQTQVDQWFNQLKTESPGASAIVPVPRSLRVMALLVDERDDGPVIMMQDGQDVSTQIYPLPPQRSAVLVIGSAGLFDRSLTWRIPEGVAVGSQYKVRLVVSWYPMPYMMDQTVGRGMPAFYPRRILSDESDAPFSIVTRDEPTPEPVDVEQLLREVQSLRQQVAAMQKTITQMSSAIDTLERVIRSLIGR